MSKITNLLGVAIDWRFSSLALERIKESMLQRELSDTDGELDGSAAGMLRFLRELVDLAGQAEEAHTGPVLELQFGDVLTKTSVSVQGSSQFLAIASFLPRDEAMTCVPRLPEEAISVCPLAGGDELLWHADEGCYVIVRYIPIKNFPDEASVLDAIMDASEEAKEWAERAGNAFLPS